ncbi:MAG: DinB family protein [Saprospiraceae bacterium]|nr:DinB family protein [Saprospiraceae bacterium]
MQLLIKHIIEQLLNNQKGKAWIGSTYDSKLNVVNDENAFIRPLPDLHSVAEIISHLTSWQKETVLKIQTGIGHLTDDSEENWYSNEKLKEKKWATIWKEYQASLAEIIALLRSKEDSFLEEPYYDTDFKGNYPYSFVINGMLHHNLYHLGQLGIIVKYLKKIDQ